jgi:hypothetical protein
MDISVILEQIDAEISRLQQAKSILSGQSAVIAKRLPGRPKRTQAASTRTKRTLSPEAKERIAAAQRLRWAKSRRAVKKAAKKTRAKKLPAKKSAKESKPEAAA